MNLSPRVMEIKINKWDLVKLKNIFPEKETINKMKLPYRMGEYLQMIY